MVDNIRMDPLEVGWGGGMDCIGLAQEYVQVADSCECGSEPSGSINFVE